MNITPTSLTKPFWIKKHFTFFIALAVLSLTTVKSQGQTLWSSTSGSAWLTGTNWTGSTVPGSATVTTNTGWAQFGTSPTSATSGVGINMSTANANGAFYLGAIEITSARINNFLIGNSTSTKDGILTLNGTTINSTNNVILRTSSSGAFTIQDAQGGTTAHLGLAPGNVTNNIILIDGSGGIVISSIISGTKPVGLSGAGTGKLQLTAANTYTGTLTVNATTLQLDHTGGTTLPVTNNIVISGGTLQISTNQTLNNLTLANGATLTIDNGVVLTINGTFNQNGGTINGSGSIAYGASAILSYGGTSAQTTGIELPASISGLTINNSNGVSLNSATRVTGVLTLQLGILNTNNDLTLASTSSGTASLAQVADYTTTNINGNVTAERYIPAHAARAYTMVCSPVSGSTIYNAWQEGGASTPGYGTQISGASAGNGFDFVSAAGISSIYKYNDQNATGSKWVGWTNTNSTLLDHNTGWLLFVRGDRTVGASSTTPSATTLRATGTVYIGPDFEMTTVFGSNYYSLNANPYPCAIRWSTMYRNDVTNVFTVYDPNLQTFVTSDGTTVSPNVSQQQPDIIQSGQAFFCQTVNNPSDPHLVVHESDKIISAATSSANTVFPVLGGGTSVPGLTPQLNINFYKANNTFADGAVAVFNSSVSTKGGIQDASKFTNFGETISFIKNNKNLSIDASVMPSVSDTLVVDMKQMIAGTTYNMVIDGSGFNSNNLRSAILVDKLAGISRSLDLSVQNNYSFSSNAATETGRLYIVLSNASETTVAGNTNTSTTGGGLSVTLLGNPVNDQVNLRYTASQAGSTTIRLVSISGHVLNILSLGTQQQGTVTIPVLGYASGLYLVQVKVGNAQVITKVVKQ